MVSCWARLVYETGEECCRFYADVWTQMKAIMKGVCVFMCLLGIGWVETCAHIGQLDRVHMLWSTC